MLEKNGEMKLGESYTDDGSGKKAKLLPKTKSDLIIELDGLQESVDVSPSKGKDLTSPLLNNTSNKVQGG